LIKTELANVEQKKLLAQDTNDPSCPLCEQNLSAARKRFLKTKFIKVEDFYHHRLARFSALLKHLKQLLVVQHASLEELKKKKEQSIITAIKRDELLKTREKITLSLTETSKRNTLLIAAYQE